MVTTMNLIMYVKKFDLWKSNHPDRISLPAPAMTQAGALSANPQRLHWPRAMISCSLNTYTNFYYFYFDMKRAVLLATVRFYIQTRNTFHHTHTHRVQRAVPSNVSFDELLEHFVTVQKKHSAVASRKAAVQTPS